MPIEEYSAGEIARALQRIEHGQNEMARLLRDHYLPATVIHTMLDGLEKRINALETARAGFSGRTVGIISVAIAGIALVLSGGPAW